MIKEVKEHRLKYCLICKGVTNHTYIKDRALYVCENEMIKSISECMWCRFNIASNERYVVIDAIGDNGIIEESSVVHAACFDEIIEELHECDALDILIATRENETIQ